MKRFATMLAAASLTAAPAFAQSAGDPINLNNMQYGEVATSLVTYNPQDGKGTAAMVERRFAPGNTLAACIRDAYAASAAGGKASVICRLANGQNAVAVCRIENAYALEPVCRWVNRP